MLSQFEKYLPELLRVLLLEQIEIARAKLADKSLDFNDVVHDVRTGFKKIRAYILLLRTDLGEDIYKTESRCFRDEGKGIAELRDSHVVYSTLEQLVVNYQDQLQNSTVNKILKNLAIEYETKKKLALEQDALMNLAGRLRDNKNRIHNWILPQDNDGSVFERLKDRYARGAKQMRDAETNKDDEKLHNWRKNVKHLWYQVRIFEPCKPEIMTAYAESLHSLSDYLGEDHDLVVLNANLPAQHDIENKTDLNVLRDRISAEREKLQAGAFPLARSIFAESPEQFADRIAGYWRNRMQQPV